MAILRSRVLFFTTSPRSPQKMIPEISLLHQHFSGKKWNNESQIEFINRLSESDFFEGRGSPTDKAFSARDRINRAPKALGFINLNPTIELTQAGKEFIFGKRYQEVFLRQLLKFQLPSPYHVEDSIINGSFRVRPYLEVIRLIRTLGYLSFNEVKIFALQLTDYRNFDVVKQKIENFRFMLKLSKGDKSKYINNVWNSEISTIYSDEINTGQTQTRQSRDTSIKKFLATKRSNQRDYADACFRYLRMSGIISISHRGHSVFIDESKYKEVDFILSNVDREPIYIDEIDSFKKYLFDPTIPSLFTDNKANLVNQIMKLSSYTRQDLVNKSINELKDLKDEIIEEKREALFSDQVRELKSYSLYSEIIDTFNEIITDDIYDAPLILEWNTWRAMTMLNGGIIKGNFKVDDSGQPMSTAQGNMPDIECDYGEFALSVEVTLQAGQRQYETEGEPVARHYGQLKKRAGKETYCLFIAPTINHATLAHFFTLNKTEIFYYGGKARIIPLELDQFMRLVENSYNFKGNPTESHVKSFLSFASNLVDKSANEKVWIDSVYDSINDWPSN